MSSCESSNITSMYLGTMSNIVSLVHVGMTSVSGDAFPLKWLRMIRGRAVGKTLLRVHDTHLPLTIAISCRHNLSTALWQCLQVSYSLFSLALGKVSCPLNMSVPHETTQGISITMGKCVSKECMVTSPWIAPGYKHKVPLKSGSIEFLTIKLLEMAAKHWTTSQ